MLCRLLVIVACRHGCIIGVTEEEAPRARQNCSDACELGYVSMNEEVNINRVEHYSLCDWEDASYV